MLKVGLTGGIAAGKSMVARRLRELGAVLIDADAIARQVVEPGTRGLQTVVDAFGDGVLDPHGALDRKALADIVFADEEHRQRLNAIVHPLVRTRSAQLAEEAGTDSIVVQDIPLLVESGQGARFHLVVVVEAPADVRVARMVGDRGMTEPEARARMAAQAADHERRAAADVILDNTGRLTDLMTAVDRLWHRRLVPFSHHLAAGTVPERPGPPVLVDCRADWADQAARLAARLRAADPRILAVDHIGSTAVPGLPAKDVLDLQVSVAAGDDLDAVGPALAAAGFPRRGGIRGDVPRPSTPDPAAWPKRLHASADPGRSANVHVRVAGSAGWRFALAFRDWLRADTDACARYLAEKRRLAAVHAGDSSAVGYARDKEEWFSRVADPALTRWIAAGGWVPPQY